jgi:hypothetical protein
VAPVIEPAANYVAFLDRKQLGLLLGTDLQIVLDLGGAA